MPQLLLQHSTGSVLGSNTIWPGMVFVSMAGKQLHSLLIAGNGIVDCIMPDAGAVVSILLKTYI